MIHIKEEQKNLNLNKDMKLLNEFYFNILDRLAEDI